MGHYTNNCIKFPKKLVLVLATFTLVTEAYKKAYMVGLALLRSSNMYRASKNWHDSKKIKPNSKP